VVALLGGHETRLYVKILKSYHSCSEGETMPMRPTLALIATRPGSLQDSLVALMTTMHQVNAVLIAEDGASALRTMAQHRPALVVLELDLPAEERHAVLNEIKTRWPLTRCIALAEDIEQRREAESAGADVVLIKGFPAAGFIAAIEELLSREERE
jgi:DNA-binding NarL/FixJ family response regulator